MYTVFAFKIYFVLLTSNILMNAGNINNMDIQVPQIENDVPIYHLPNYVKPILYKLSILPDFSDEFVFTGIVEIQIKILKSTRNVNIYSKNLKIMNASIYNNDQFKLNIEIQERPKEEILILYSTKEELIEKNEYVLNIHFKGNFNDTKDVFYYSSYRIGNATKSLLTTAFGLTGARRVFPCYDEPIFKTPFNISVARYSNQTAISNMPVKFTSEPDSAINGRVWDFFEVSPAMATYSVAFIVSEFSQVTDTSRNISIWLRRNVKHHAKELIREGKLLLEQMENFTGINYSLPKMDLAAIPDLRLTTVENWGLITAKEQYLICDPDICSAKEWEDSVRTVAHKISTQWFGNYVIPSKWFYVWLINGFGTYFGHHVTAQVEPTWRMDHWYVVNVVQSALRLEETYNTTMTVELRNSHATIFDSIIYKKAGSVLRMLEHIVSTENFKKALSAYLKNGYNSHDLLEPGSLWIAFEESMKRKPVPIPEGWNLVNIMEKWMTNIGHPLINITRVSKDSRVNILISQTRYNSPKSEINEQGQSWVIHVICTRQSSPDFYETNLIFWNLPNQPNVLENGAETNEWILCNVQQTGYYRVQYDDENWELLIQQLHSDHKIIHPLNRAQLIDDSCVLALDGYLSFIIPFKIMKYLVNETDPIPLTTAIDHLQYFYNVDKSRPHNTTLKTYIIELLIQLYNRFGFENSLTDDHSIKVLRSKLTSFACTLNIDACVKAARNQYEINARNLSSIDPNVKGTVFCTMLQTDSNKIIQTVGRNIWMSYEKSVLPSEIKTILHALGCTKNTTLLQQYLNKLMKATDTDIHPRNFDDVLNSVFSSSRGIYAGVELIRFILPQYRNLSVNKLKTFSMIAMYTALRADTEETQEQVGELILTLKKRDQRIYANLTENLQNALQKAQSSTKNKKIIVNKMYIALKDILPTTSSSITLKRNSKLVINITVFVTFLTFYKNVLPRLVFNYCD